MLDERIHRGGVGGDGTPGPEAGYSVLNPQYTCSYWMVAYSEDVRLGRIIPLKVLERDVILWRERGGRLHCHDAICPHLGAHIAYGGEVHGDVVQCPFHGWCYDGQGCVTSIPGIKGKPKTAARLKSYRVVERYGSVFVWNGTDPPDHEFPDILTEEGLIDRQDSLHFVHCRFACPFPAKLFYENLPDSAHFATLHGAGGWGETVVLEETPTKIVYEGRFHDTEPYWTLKNLRRLYRKGELFVAMDNAAQDLHITTHGGGLHVLGLTEGAESDAEPRTAIGRLKRRFYRDFRIIFCFSPVEERTHNLMFTLVLPKVAIPIAGPVVDRVVGFLAGSRFMWLGVMQDSSVQYFRREPENPAYNRFDRGLIQFRRWADGRLLDRTLWAGDGVHSTGRRGGIEWPDAPGREAGPGGATLAGDVAGGAES